MVAAEPVVLVLMVLLVHLDLVDLVYSYLLTSVILHPL